MSSLITFLKLYFYFSKDMTAKEDIFMGLIINLIETNFD
jgi:hypothetical protein